MIPGWIWELDRHLNEVALDVVIAAVVAAAITEGLRFAIEAL